jgi:transcriptional regulator GlxA family with amidase domain
VAVVLFDEVELFDVAGACSVLSAAGRQWNFRPFKIHTVASRVGPVETRSQVRLEARLTFSAVAAPEVIVVPGGYGARRALSDTGLLAWLKSAGQSATHLLGIGNGVLLLAAAGLLENHTVAARRELEGPIKEYPPGHSAASSSGSSSASTALDHEIPVLRSKNLFTAQSSAHAADAALALVSALLGSKQASVVAETLGIPFASGSPEQVAIVEKG